VTCKYAAGTNLTQQEVPEWSRRTSPSPRPQSKPKRSKILRDQRGGLNHRLLHNHPSGDLKPSRDDIEMTREVKAAAEALGIAIHDHLVIGRKGHASFRGLGLL
jgi:RadC-like JAB domain-containing protein